MTTVYVRLLDEQVDVWRPVEATAQGDLVYKLVDDRLPDDETWEFGPGARVRCEWRDLDGTSTLVAASLA